MWRELFGASILVTTLAAIPLGSLAPVAAHSPCGTSARVQSGDTLYRIAKRCGVPVQEILRANPGLSNPNYIQLGMTLRLSGRGGAVQPNPASRAYDTYTVRRGDTLSIIARRFDVSLRAVIAANRDLGNPNHLRVGDVVRIPGRGAGGSGPSKPNRPSPPSAPNTFTIIGTLTSEGVACQAMRDDDGRLYTLVGNMVEGRSGDRVQVLGNRVQQSICQQGTTLEALRIRQLDRQSPPAPPLNSISVFGTLTDEGVECQALRDHSGRLYTLTGNIDGFSNGETVRVEGTIAEFSFCQQGTTIEVDFIDEVRG